jgi:hypothetical protein
VLRRDDGTLFSVGRAKFADLSEAPEEGTPKIFVKIATASSLSPVPALLDTGAPWSVLDSELAEELDLLGGKGERVPISTRLGTFTGRLERTRIDILADEGESITVDATVWVSEKWPGGTFVGYQGLLERIRFAIDPSDNSFYFAGL